jgi:hypothetical protein
VMDFMNQTRHSSASKTNEENREQHGLQKEQGAYRGRFELLVRASSRKVFSSPTAALDS